jgi:phage tail sheath protein FI
MPVTPTFPGVYIEEIPSGVRTITGVATSITAFLGRSSLGPVNEPITITSFADFERFFGPLAVNYPMTYAVQDFYLNGGSQAIIVRLYKAAAANDDGKARLDLGGGLELAASSPGSWGKKLQASVDTNGITDDVAASFGLPKADLFNVTIQYDPDNKGPKEVFLNLSVVEGPRRIDRVLKQLSRFVNVDTMPDPPAVPASNPAIHATGGTDSAPLTGSADFLGDRVQKTGMGALEKADLFNLLCIPPDTRLGDTPPKVYQDAMSYCATRRAMLIVDSPAAWSTDPQFISNALNDLTSLGLNGPNARNAALFFPRVLEADSLRQDQVDKFVPCGIIAGVMARTDTQRGVWKAPAGMDASLNGIQGLDVILTNDDNGNLNPLGINCLRTFPVVGSVVWGSRTLRGANQLADEYKYIPVRRTALYIEESLYRGTQWVVFEPNDEPLWAQIRLNVGAFMQNLFRQGAFQGQTPRDAYFVKCDKETTTQNDINLGIVNIVVGFAPLKPAEFVIIKIQQIAGQIQV